jgi:HAD superfamily hydrolase (TIGR01509 family)
VLRLVIFDFDGVIADSESGHFETFRQVCCQDGINLTWQQYSQKYLGYTDTECIAAILDDFGCESTPARIDDLLKRKGVLFARYIEQNSIIMPGVKPLLLDLRNHNILCSICSGALDREVKFVLEREELTDYFKVIITAEHVTRGKPDPQGYNLCLSKTNDLLPDQAPIRTDQSVVIEDSIWGIQAAHAAKMRCLALATTYQPEQLQVADMTAMDLTQINTETLCRILG